MSRHNVFVSLSRPQAEFLSDLLTDDLADSALDDDERTTATGALSKIDRALAKVNARHSRSCGPDCKCRAERESRR